jgi:hypothetical protein
MHNLDPEPFVTLAAAGIVREYPNKPSNVMTCDGNVRSPLQLHPVFYGCFDWHSAVHSHWTLVRLLRLFPEMDSAGTVQRLLDRQLTTVGLQSEADYFDNLNHRSFERMYGWAWLLQLAAELHVFADPIARGWRASIRPLENSIVSLVTDYLPRLQQPIRCGVHSDTGFALGMILDYADTVENSELRNLLVEQGHSYYFKDRDYPLSYEPSGEDFFSSGLNEADFVSRILTTNDYSAWLSGFIPSLDSGCVELTPILDVDLNDGRLAHQAGLNLSRAWTLRRMARALPEGDSRCSVLRAIADSHVAPLQSHVFSGSYDGEHWLGSFAVYLLTECTAATT